MLCYAVQYLSISNEFMIPDTCHAHDSDTLLHLAARNGHKAIVKELLRRNCEFDTKNSAGKEAWELAFDFNFSDLGDYIRDKTGLPPLSKGGGAPESVAAAAAKDGGKAGGGSAALALKSVTTDDSEFDIGLPVLSLMALLVQKYKY